MNSGINTFMTGPLLIESSCFYYMQYNVLKYLFIIKYVINVGVKPLKIKNRISIGPSNLTCWLIYSNHINRWKIYLQHMFVAAVHNN